MGAVWGRHTRARDPNGPANARDARQLPGILLCGLSGGRRVPLGGGGAEGGGGGWGGGTPAIILPKTPWPFFSSPSPHAAKPLLPRYPITPPDPRQPY